MSDPYTFYAGSQSSRIHLRPCSTQREKAAGNSWVPRSYTEWSPELQMELLHFFTKCTYPYRSIEGIPFRDPLRSEIRRFFLSLDAYIESTNPVVPEKAILYGAADIKFSEYLKRVKRKSFETSWGVENFGLPEWWNEVPAYRINDIGDIFNYSYLIFFKEEDPEDYLNGWLPLTENKKWIARFKASVLGILPERETFEEISSVEVLTKLSSSISIEQGTFKHVPHYMIKNKYLRFSKNRGISERSVIRVSPNNTRDSVLLDPSDLNTISLIDQQVMEILRVMPGHIHIRDKDEVSRRYHRLYNKYTDFLHRDIRKEGITKPRALLRAMLEALKEKYPDIGIFCNTSYYDEYVLHVNGELMYPPRGHGLGMANSLTTLMQLAVHELILCLLLDDIPHLDMDILCLNDDFVAGFKDDYHLESYWDMEDEVMGKLSIIRQPDKSFRSYNCFVLAERYFTNGREFEKESYQRRELLLPLACANITHAKEYFISAQTYVNSKYVPIYMEEILSYWGYEFYPMEFSYPSKVGGWINEKINTVDLTFKILDSLDFKSYVSRGFKAVKTQIFKGKKGEIFSPPLLSLYGYPKIPKEFEGHFDILSMSELNSKYGRVLSKSTREFSKFWDTLYKVRQKVFKKPYDITYEGLLEEMNNFYESTQFYPSDQMVSRYHQSNITRIPIGDPYLDPNPKLSILAKYNASFEYPFKEEFSIRFTEPDPTTKKQESLFSKEIQRAVKSEVIAVLSTGRHHEMYYPLDFSPEEQYLNPTKIGEVTSILNWGLGYPELKPNFRHPLIEKKREVFDHLFSLQELNLISQRGLSRPTLKLIMNFCKRNPEWDLQRVLDSIEVSKEQVKILEDMRKEPDYPRDDRTITIDRLIVDDGCFWNWRQNPDDYVASNSEVGMMLGKLDQTILYLTHPTIRTPNQKEEILRDRKSVV